MWSAGYLTLSHFKALFLSNFWEYHHKSYRGLIILSETWFYGHIFVAESLCLTSTTVTQLAPISTKFNEITPNNGHYVVQGHSRSPISVPIESTYAISYYWIILTYILSHTVSNLWCNMSQIFAFEWGTFLTHYFSVISEKIPPWVIYYRKLDSLAYIYVADSVDRTLTTVT